MGWEEGGNGGLSRDRLLKSLNTRAPSHATIVVAHNTEAWKLAKGQQHDQPDELPNVTGQLWSPRVTPAFKVVSTMANAKPSIAWNPG